MMNRRLFGLLIAGLLLGGSVLGEALAAVPQILPRVVVVDNVVTLGDIFDDAGGAADVVVARAPAPGQRMAISMRRIYSLARANGLDWNPPYGLDRVIVRRASRRISEIEIAARIQDELAAAAHGENLRVEFARNSPELHVAVGASDIIDFESLVFDARTGRFAVSLVAAPGTADAVRAEFTGRAIQVIEIPVLIRRLRRGDVIADGDVEWIEWPASRLPADAILDEADLVGLALRRSIRSGQPVRDNDVQAPIVVAKGAKVMLVYRTLSMVLTASGQALEDGAMGATIRVLNSYSKIVIEATVEGGSIVSVSPDLRFALN